MYWRARRLTKTRACFCSNSGTNIVPEPSRLIEGERQVRFSKACWATEEWIHIRHTKKSCHKQNSILTGSNVLSSGVTGGLSWEGILTEAGLLDIVEGLHAKSQKNVVKMIANPTAEGYNKTLNHWKTHRKMQKYTNLLKTSGTPVLRLACHV